MKNNKQLQMTNNDKGQTTTYEKTTKAKNDKVQTTTNVKRGQMTYKDKQQTTPKYEQ